MSTNGRGTNLHVVVGVDGGSSGWAALRGAADLARRLRARLDVVHVAVAVNAAAARPATWAAVPFQPISPSVQADVQAMAGLEAHEEERHLLAEAERVLRHHEADWVFHSRRGEPGEALLEFAEEVDAYCVVVGSRGEGIGAFLDRLAHPSTSHALIRARHRPVLVVGSDEDE